MPSSLIPEKPLTISPSLASTIGLEEAVMLHGFHERMRFSKPTIVDGYKWFAFEQHDVEESFPFWQVGDVQRIAISLKDKGIVLLAPEPYLIHKILKLALNEKVVSAVESKPTYIPPVAVSSPVLSSQVIVPPPIAPRQPVMSSVENPFKKVGITAQAMQSSWRPDTEILKQILKHGIPLTFAEECLPEFISYWQERKEAHHSWTSKFLKWVVRCWREEETIFAAKQRSSNLSDIWSPSEDAFEVLQQGGVDRSFIEESVAEFVLYWREKGDSSNTWNSKFVQHVRHQWAKVTHALQNDSTPKPISPDWQPSADVFDILHMANIDATFAKNLVPEFILFWRETNQLHNSWNSKFLQHVKFHWAKRHQLNAKYPSAANKDSVGFIERHTDTSWADSL